jgi:hypothetical protein
MRYIGAMQEQQRTFLQDAWVGYLKEMPELGRLREKLLSFGGEEVVPVKEEDLDKILNRGILLNSPIIKLISGRPCGCHENSANYWDLHQRTSELMTGWALSEDGLWRQHSWVRIIKSGRVVETTTRRSMYFGFVMTQDEADEFVAMN